MNEKLLIICESLYNQNTMKLANAMANRLECQVIGFDEALQTNLDSCELLPPLNEKSLEVEASWVKQTSVY
ncbi:MAG: hypothetical protein KKH92_10420 [Firmicutes bacterium]|nr:hypothetical protein [Bacillota bacterium]